MTRALVWDLPTRVFHWCLALGFATAAIFALALGEHSPLFPYHAIIGLTLVAMVVLRVAWGVAGSRYARFGSFLFHPRAVFGYTLGVLSRHGRRHVGHNPGSAYAIFAMLGLVLALGVTGLMMATGNESAEDLHEILAWTMVGVVVLHILGVVVHSAAHKENITASMIHGRKDAAPEEAIRSSHPVVATGFLIVTGVWGVALLSSYDSASQTTKLPLLGTTLTVGEGESENSERGRASGGGNEHDEGDEHEEHDDD